MLKEEFTRPLSTFEVISHLLGGMAGLICGALYFWFRSSSPHLIEYVLLFWIPAVLLHELAHAVTAKLSGGHVNVIKLGLTIHPSGKHVSFRFIGFNWEIYSAPLTGIVFVFFTDPKRFRTQATLMTAAGPLASLIAAISGLLPIIYGNTAEPLAGWFLVNTYFFLGTAVPSYRIRKRGTSQTDGYRIWKTWHLSTEEISKKCALGCLHLELQTEKDLISRLSVEEAIRRHESSPNSTATLLHLIDKLERLGDSRQNDYVMKLISDPQIAPINFTAFLDAYITRHLTADTIAKDSRFDFFSAKLVAVSNQSITAQGTRGAVLIDLGQIEEGKGTLKEVIENTREPIDKIYANIFLALAEKQAGNLEAAKNYARQATSLDPTCPALRRVDDLLRSSRNEDPTSFSTDSR
jgi:hypothetical protein